MSSRDPVGLLAEAFSNLTTKPGRARPVRHDCVGRALGLRFLTW